MRTSRIAVSLAAAAVTVLTGTGAASAHSGSDNAALTASVTADGNFTYADVYRSGNLIGWGIWSQDPTNGIPGDAMQAFDNYADGRGIVAHLSTGRTVSTAGHPKGYATEWKGGDLTEDQTYYFWACSVKDDVEEDCTNPVKVSS